MAGTTASHIAETLGKQYALDSHWHGNRLVVDGHGVNGHLDAVTAPGQGFIDAVIHHLEDEMMKSFRAG